MNCKFNLAIWADTGVGGMEKAAVLFAVELVKRGHRVIYLGPPGPREPALRQGHVLRVDKPATVTALADFFRSERIELIHQHVPGYGHDNPIYDALHLAGEHRPRLIETNVFGRLEDPGNDRWIDFRCFVSRASAVQAFLRKHRPLDATALAKSTYLTNPLASLSSPAQASRDEIRAELGIKPGELLVLRIGRPGGKWTFDEVAAFQRARRRNSALRLLLMEPSGNIWDEVEAGRWGEGIVLHRIVSDFDRLAAIYTAGDLMLHMSDWGESFGYTIAEAMQNGQPVIVRSTPWGDNAQVDLVEHGVTGYVCNSRPGAAESLLRLAGDAALRHSFGTAGRERINRMTHLESETDLLEEIIAHVVQGDPLQLVTARNQGLIEFGSTFGAREKRVYELDVPGLQGADYGARGYSGYRQLRSWAGVYKNELKARLKGMLKR